MAASNAIFWDGYHWDGSEEMIQRSRDLCIRAPKHHHIDPLSGSTIVTIIVTLQGVQAIYSIIYGSVSPTASYSASVAISTIFYPLASLSLLRLPAALWLTNDYAYRHNEDWDLPGGSEIELGPNVGKQSESAPALIVRPTMSSMSGPIDPDRFHNHRTWPSIILRSFYLIMVMGLLALCLYELLSEVGYATQSPWTATNFTLVLTFLLFLAVTTGILLAYIILDRCRTTIIPCITATWYKVYTGLLFAAMFTVFVLAAIESRKSPCGAYTTYTEASGADYELCGKSLFVDKAAQQYSNSTIDGGDNVNGTTVLVYDSILFNQTYGMAMTANDGNIIVLAFDGWCKIDSEITPANISMFQPLNFTLIG